MNAPDQDDHEFWDSLVWHFQCPHCGFKRVQGDGPGACGYTGWENRPICVPEKS